MWQVLVTLGGSKYFLKTLLFMGTDVEQQETARDIPYQHHQLQTRLAGQENDVQWLTETYISCSEITEDRALPGGRNPHLNL